MIKFTSMVANLLIQPECHMPTKTVTTHIKKKVDKIIQRDTKYSNIRNHIPSILYHPEQ